MLSRYRIIAVTAALIILALVAGCTYPGGSPAAQPAQSLPSGTPTPAAQQTVPLPSDSPVTSQTTLPLPPNLTNVVTINNFAFSPSALTIKARSSVTWVNQDKATHTITADDSSTVTFSSKELPSGGSYSFSFSKPGTYSYHCSIHPSMVGTIIVES